MPYIGPDKVLAWSTKNFTIDRTYAQVSTDRSKYYIKYTKDKINPSKTDKANKSEFMTVKENNTTINKNFNNSNNSEIYKTKKQ